MKKKALSLKWSDERKELRRLEREVDSEVEAAAYEEVKKLSMLEKCKRIDSMKDGWKLFDKYCKSAIPVSHAIESFCQPEFAEIELDKDIYKKRLERIQYLEKIVDKQSKEARLKRQKEKINNDCLSQGSSSADAKPAKEK